MLILITNKFSIDGPSGIPTGRTELLVDYAIDSITGEAVVVPCDSPQALGATYHRELCEWVIE